MRPKITAASLFVLLSVLPVLALSPVGTHGRLKIADGKMIGSKDNQPVQLAGMSLFWSLWEGEKYYNRKVVNWLVKNWNITVLRACLGIGQGGYEAEPSNTGTQYTMIKTVVDAAIANGIYVIVDFHAHDANLHVEAAKKFFADMSKEYAGVPNVIWEIWNEPDVKNGSGIVFPPDGEMAAAPNSWDNWRDIKKYASTIIPVIRANSENLIVVGTPYWSQFVDTAAADPLTYPDIAYTLHFYAGQKQQQDSLRQRARRALELGAPMFITECGTTISDGGSDGVVDSVQTRIWLDWADSNAISWVNWSIVDKGEASAALKPGAADTGGWADDKISASGILIRKRLRDRPAYDFSEIIPDDGKSLPGLIEAESCVAKSSGLKVDASGDGGGQCLGYTSNGAWADYLVVARRAGDYRAKLRVASADGGTITLKSGDKKLASWKVANTGGWSTWKTTDDGDRISLAEGELKLRVEWSGTASSLVNLNWLQFTLVSGSDTLDTIPEDTGSVVIIPEGGKTLPGRIEAESLTTKSKDLTIEATSDTTGDKNLGYTTNGAWAEYSVNVLKAGDYTVRFRVAVEQGFGGTLAMKIGEKQVGSWAVGSTGGWTRWVTTVNQDTFELAAGETVMRIEWSGTASSLVNLNWMEFTCHSEQSSIGTPPPVTHTPRTAIAVSRGILSVYCPAGTSKIELLSIDGRVLQAAAPRAGRHSMSIGKGVFVLALYGSDGMVRSQRVVHF